MKKKWVQDEEDGVWFQVNEPDFSDMPKGDKIVIIGYFFLILVALIIKSA